MLDHSFSPYLLLVKDGENYGVVMSADGSPIMSLKEAREEARLGINCPGIKYVLISIEQQFDC